MEFVGEGTLLCCPARTIADEDKHVCVMPSLDNLQGQTGKIHYLITLNHDLKE